ncbi:MAG: hypothetical protein AAFW70_11800 [Cyanobacteria bacterium J06635_10]
MQISPGFRFGHTQTGNKIENIDADGNIVTLPFLTTFGAPNVNVGSDVNNILPGSVATVDEEVDTNVVFDLSNALFPPAGVGFYLYSAKGYFPFCLIAVPCSKGG